MRTTEFVEKWIDLGDVYGSRLCRLPESTETSISTETRKFLMLAGLPESAAPCLGFDQVECGLDPIWEHFGSPHDWNDAERQRLSRFLMVGSDGGGNPICIDQATHDQILLLDHESDFKNSQFVNTSVAQLAEFLLVFQQLIFNYQKEFGTEAALFEGLVPAVFLNETVIKMQQIDAQAMDTGAFWPAQLRVL